MNKISGPLLDRFDIQVEVKQVSYKNLTRKCNERTSKEIKERVNYARKIQEERYRNYSIYSNSELSPSMMEKFCRLDRESEKILWNKK